MEVVYWRPFKDEMALFPLHILIAIEALPSIHRYISFHICLRICMPKSYFQFKITKAFVMNQVMSG